MSRSISARTVSTANSGMPCAWPAIAARAAAGIPGTRASTSWSIDARSSGSRVSVRAVAPGAEPGPGLVRARGGRTPARRSAGRGPSRPGGRGSPAARRRRAGRPRPAAPPAASRRAARRTAATRRTAPPGTAAPPPSPANGDAEQPAQPRADVGPLARVGNNSLQPAASFAAAVPAGSSSAMPSRCRTISASAQNATPSP